VVACCYYLEFTAEPACALAHAAHSVTLGCLRRNKAFAVVAQLELQRFVLHAKNDCGFSATRVAGNVIDAFFDDEKYLAACICPQFEIVIVGRFKL